MIEADMDNARRIAIAIFWRCVAYSFVAGAIIGFVIGFIFSFLSVLFFSSADFGTRVQVISALFGLVASFVILNWILKNQIGKSFGSYRLVLERTA